MSTSKKNYVAIAAIISGEWGCWPNTAGAGVYPKSGDEFARSALKSVASQLADHFARGNPAFDRARFLAACGIKS